MILKLGFSTCPNDTFMFDAMVHQKIDTENLTFQISIADVEELNKNALTNKLDITKLSFYAYAYVSNNYVLLDAGAALGNNNGPLLISKQKIYPDEVRDLLIAIPGKYTTANLLLSIAYPDIKKKTEYLFSDIEDVVLSNETDAGLLIHENRFTYKAKGLKKIIDLGEYWEEITNLPVPLGGIAVKKELSVDVQQKINRVLRRSIEFALKNPKSSLDYIRKHASAMDEQTIYKHINLYVNDYSIDLGKKGKLAIKTLYEKAQELHLIPEIEKQIFL